MKQLHSEFEQEIYAEFAELRDVPEPWYYQKWMIISFVICVLIHHVISPVVFSRHNRAYRALPRDRRMEWDSRATSHVGLLALSISVGYFLCDLISMPLYWWNKQLLIFIFHHVAAAYAFFYVVDYRSCVFFGVYRLTTEMSTPFVNQRWFYRTIGYKPDRRRVASVALMFAILFAITRNLMILPFWFVSYQALYSRAHEICVKHIPWLDFSFVACCVVLDILNVYWAPTTYKIGIRAAKFLRTANWADDIQLARTRLRKRLHHLRHQIQSKSLNQLQNTLLTAAVTTVRSGQQPLLRESGTEQPLVSPSSSDYSSDTEYEFADSDMDSPMSDVNLPELDAPDANNVNSSASVETSNPESDETQINRRSTNSQ